MNSHFSTAALKWLSLVGVIWLQTFNGTNADFPAYSSQLKYLLSISQVQLNNLAVASDAGKLLGWLSGVAAHFFPLWLVLFIGAALGLVGYGFQYLFIVREVSLAYWQVLILNLLAGNSICWINTVCYLATMQNFPADSRIALSLSTSYQGLSAKMYATVVDAFIPARYVKGSYLLLNSVAPIAVSTVFAPFLRRFEVGDRPGITNCGFVALISVAFVTGIYAVVGSVGAHIPPMVLAIGLLILMVAPLTLPIGVSIREVLEQKWKSRDIRVFDYSVENESGDGLDKVVAEGSGHGDEEAGRFENGRIEEKEELEWAVNELLRSLNFWLYFMVYLMGATLGLVFLNNLGQIAESRGHSKTSTLVSLSSSCGFFGRLMPSIVDYYSSKWKVNLPRTISMGMLMVPMVVAFFMLAISSTSITLYVSTAVLGVCTGAISSISVSATPELFGTKNFGLNHNIVVANIPLGSFFFGYAASVLYDREGGGTGRCVGMACFQRTFISWGCVSSVGVLLSIWLFIRTRK
ncbi:NUCLEAR FUSION DEFECTIVE 4 protein [Nymphaea thermarum]|nr:NUCLEAR FUSION DEFECTIVE 4 protein [Nymphaea thermarum]